MAKKGGYFLKIDFVTCGGNNKRAAVVKSINFPCVGRKQLCFFH